MTTQPKTISIAVKGMHCGSCVNRVEQAIKEIDSVEQAWVNLATEKATVELSEGAKESKVFDQIRKRLKESNYETEILAKPFQQWQNLQKEKREEVEQWKKRVLYGGILTLPIVAIEMTSHLSGNHISAPVAIVLMILCAIVLIYSGRSFFENSVREFRRLSFTMDTLIAVGSGASFIYSAGQIARSVMMPDAMLMTHFESASLIVVLICAGKGIEARMKRQSLEQLSGLLDSVPKTARKIGKDGTESEVPVEALGPKDMIVVRAGETFPLDSICVEGSSQADFAIVTGESKPQVIEPGVTVPSGALCLDGKVVMKVTRSGEDSTLMQILTSVESAQNSKPKIQRLTDQISAVFVPTVLVLSIFVFFGHLLMGSAFELAFTSTIAVLVIACPCALGIATPSALLAGTTLMSRWGILFRDGLAIERAALITEVVFDKTGTLTRGKPRLMKIVSLDQGHSKKELLTIAASLEQGSAHPYGKAIEQSALRREISLQKIQNFKQVAGAGIQGSLNNQAFVIGQQSFAATASISNEAQQTVDEILKEDPQLSPIWLGDQDSGQALGVFFLKDTLRSTAQHTVDQLRDYFNLNLWLASGDEKRLVEDVAEQIGINPDQTLARVSPSDKEALVQRLEDDNRPVAMIGDGANDAPALSRATLGISLPEGTDIAKQSAHVHLMDADLRKVLRAFYLAKLTRLKVKQNLGWAFLYNVLLIPAAMMGYIHPAMAALAMALSNISVVCNSVLLLRHGPKKPNSRS